MVASDIHRSIEQERRNKSTCIGTDIHHGEIRRDIHCHPKEPQRVKPSNTAPLKKLEKSVQNGFFRFFSDGYADGKRLVRFFSGDSL